MNITMRGGKRPSVGISSPFFVIGTLVCFSCVAVVAVRPQARDGLGGLFLLPLGASLCCFFFSDMLARWKESLGLSILLTTVATRYVVSPVLIALSGHTVSNLSPSAAGYRFAILMSLLELFTVFITLKLIWKPQLWYDRSLLRDTFHLTWVGVLVILGLGGLLMVRGRIGNVFSHLSFLTTTSTDYTPVYTYDLTAFVCLKAFLFIVVAGWAGRRHQKSKSHFRFLYVLIALSAAFLNVAFYDHTQRSVLVELTIATIAVLICVFPHSKKLFVFAGVGGIVILVGSSFLSHTMHMTMGEIKILNAAAFNNVSENVELYINGVSTMAQSYDSYEVVRAQMSLATYAKDFIQGLNFTSIPGLDKLRTLVADVSTTDYLFRAVFDRNSGYILPTAGQTLYYGSVTFGWLLDVLVCVVCVKLLFFFHELVRRTRNVAGVFTYTFFETVCGFCLCYNVTILLSCFTYLAFYIWLLMKLNTLGGRRASCCTEEVTAP